jgi:hypothetical protein
MRVTTGIHIAAVQRDSATRFARVWDTERSHGRP